MTNRQHLDDMRYRHKRNAVVFWIAGLGGSYAVLAGLLKFLYSTLASAGAPVEPLANLVAALARYLYDWPITRDIWRLMPLIDNAKLVSTANVVIGLLYLATAMLMGLARVNVAQAAWLRRLEREAQEGRIRAIYAGRADHPIPPSSEPANEDWLDSYRREKFHDRYLAPLIIGLLLIAVQFALKAFGGS